MSDFQGKIFAVECFGFQTNLVKELTTHAWQATARQLLDNSWLHTLLHEITAGTVAIWRYYTHESFARRRLAAMWIGGLLYKCIWSTSPTQASLSYGYMHHRAPRQPDVYDSCMLIYIYFCHPMMHMSLRTPCSDHAFSWLQCHAILGLPPLNVQIQIRLA